MENKEFIVNISQEQADYLQRLGNEVDSKMFVIDRLFSNHVTDTDTQLFDSIPYKHYMKEFEKAHFMWEQAKIEFEKSFLVPIVKEKTGIENPSFNWSIDDYLSLECKVTII